MAVCRLVPNHVDVSLFGAYAMLSLWLDLEAVVYIICTLVDCCMSAVLEACGLFVVGAICE